MVNARKYKPPAPHGKRPQPNTLAICFTEWAISCKLHSCLTGIITRQGAETRALPFAFLVAQATLTEINAMHDYLEQLNEAQREAVMNTNGPSMIIAGAGSGKTRVLTFRIAHLIMAEGVDPFNIMALTFTNKAAKEMRHRIEGIVGNEARNLWMGTFHSVFARILRIEAHHIGYQSNFTIYDTDDSKSQIKAIVKEQGLDDKLYKPNVVYNKISAAKNNLIDWREYRDNPIFQEDDAANMRPEIGRLYQLYAERCFKSGAMDFDDLLFNTFRLLEEHPDVLHKYQHRFRYLLIDEFQDTNIAQYKISRRLAAVNHNIAVVGDDAQSIYAFRGANINNILNFEKHFPDLKVFKLEQNYRSTNNIVEAANAVIKNNTMQLKKEVWTANPDGDLIEMIRATTDTEEGRLVATAIFEAKLNQQLKNEDFAVLYRTNSQSRSVEEALRKANIRYRIFGGLSFYQRKEIKDLLAYMRFTLNQSDEQAFRRVINLPKRGIGPGTVDKIVVASVEQNISIWEVVSNASKYLSGRAANAVNDFGTKIKHFQVEVERKDAFEAATTIAKGSGILAELYNDKTVEGVSRYENVQELLNAIKEFVDNPEREEKGLGAFLQEVALLTDADNDKGDDNDRVVLMTIHSAKGLEFKQVFVVGMEEDLFPSQMMLSNREDLEEERRLFYVAITRAQTKLSLSYALQRYRFGRIKPCEPSRFLDEVDRRFLKMNTRFTPKPQPQNSTHYARNLVSNTVGRPAQARFTKKAARHEPSPNFKPDDTSGLTEGMRVEHAKFGFGKVVKIDTSGSNRKANIHFDNFGVKTLLLSFAKLRIVE